MRTFFSLLFLIATASAAQADDHTSAAQADDQLIITKKDCLRLIRHQAAPDVAYKPGVDVHGRKVAGANLGGDSPIQIPKEIAIDIGADLNEKYGIGLDASGDKRYSAVTQALGKVKVDVLSGKVTWNDKPLDSGDTDAVRAACREKYGFR